MKRSRDEAAKIRNTREDDVTALKGLKMTVLKGLKMTALKGLKMTALKGLKMTALKGLKMTALKGLKIIEKSLPEHRAQAGRILFPHSISIRACTIARPQLGYSSIR